ncbi:hypothetical protein L2E82_16169 [Cichorium intybus]|uniref:Uncharacterized protein n=1 Tax=Cichorium intybus TaxID=13427 RepID=A0ACB9F4B3_CICIN|nr:hypothetical protein L2E82_16169 [Cichorium intybus]
MVVSILPLSLTKTLKVSFHPITALCHLQPSLLANVSIAMITILRPSVTTKISVRDKEAASSSSIRWTEHCRLTTSVDIDGTTACIHYLFFFKRCVGGVEDWKCAMVVGSKVVTVGQSGGG